MVVENGSLKNPEKTATPADGETPVEKANLNGAETTEEAEEETSFLPSWMKDPLVVFWELTMPPPERFGGGLLFTVSITFIGLCTYVMVDATNRTGVILHIPTLAMARVFLAAGTSIPDALGSIAVAKQGEGDMAVANALGSNVFDILIGLGVPWFIKTAIMQQEVQFPGKWDELVYDFIVLSFVLVLFVGCLVIHRWQLTRKVGLMLLGMYFVFLLYNVFAIWIIDPPLVRHEEEANCDVL
jgi:Ca2+/Na+ antiporter